MNKMESKEEKVAAAAQAAEEDKLTQLLAEQEAELKDLQAELQEVAAEISEVRHNKGHTSDEHYTKNMSVCMGSCQGCYAGVSVVTVLTLPPAV